MTRWAIRLSITMMSIIVILALSMRAKAQGDDMPILELEHSVYLPYVKTDLMLGLGPSLIVTLPTGDAP